MCVRMIIEAADVKVAAHAPAGLIARTDAALGFR
jgi:hypothetical protein